MKKLNKARNNNSYLLVDCIMKEVVGKVFDEKDIERMKKEQERDARLIYQNSMRYAEEEGIEENKLEIAKEMLKKIFLLKI